MFSKHNTLQITCKIISVEIRININIIYLSSSHKKLVIFHLKIPRLVPTDFIKFCDEAVRQEVPVDLNTVVTVNVSVELNEKQREYLDQEKRKFEMKICKGLKKLKTAAEE